MKSDIGQRNRLRGLLRILGWAAGAMLVLCIGFALLGMGLIALEATRSEVSLDQLRLGVWRSLYTVIVSQALLPHLLLSLVAWLVIARSVPFLERSWRPLLPGMTVTAAICFPVIGSLSFTVWTPTSSGDYVATLLLMTGGASAALALPRWLFRFLSPGAFAPPEAIHPEPSR